jgi:hypothetical protein
MQGHKHCGKENIPIIPSGCAQVCELNILGFDWGFEAEGEVAGGFGLFVNMAKEGSR